MSYNKPDQAEVKKVNKITLCRVCPAVIIMGLLSIGLYTLLYLYSGDIRQIAEQTNQGSGQLFFIPVVIALVFSFVHGTFTGQFWELLGLKAKTAK